MYIKCTEKIITYFLTKINSLLKYTRIYYTGTEYILQGLTNKT